MSGSIVIIKPDGSENSIRWPQGGQPPLETLQRCIGGGYIESVKVHYGKTRQAYVDEDGLIKNLPFNERASFLYGRRIVGDMVIWIPDSKEKVNDKASND